MIVHFTGQLLAGIALLVVAALFKAWLKATKGRRGEANVDRVIRGSSAACVTDIIIPDGRGGPTQVDPEEVSGLPELEKHLRLVAELPIPQEIEAAWQSLMAARRPDHDAKVTHLAQVRAQKAAGRLRSES